MAAYGLDAKGTPRDISFCGQAICDDSERVFEVINAKEDVRFSDNPLVVDSPLICSYISYVLKTDCGKNIGTLCVIDNLPRKFTDINIQMLKLLGCMIENIIHNRHHLDGIKHKFD